MTRKIILSAALLGAVALLLSFTTKTSATDYEYVQIIVNNKYLCTSTSNNYNEKNVSETKKGRYDCSDAIKAVEGYTSQGFELISNNFTIVGAGLGSEFHYSYLLRKAK